MRENKNQKSVRGPRHGRSEGYVLVFFALILVVLMAFIGLALDVGHAYDRRVHHQIVADAAALAASKTLTSGSTSISVETEVQRIVLDNKLLPSDFSFNCGYWDGTNFSSTAGCAASHTTNAVQVMATTEVQAVFARIAGTNSFSPSVGSVSSVPSYNCSQPFGVPIYFLQPTCEELLEEEQPLTVDFKMDDDPTGPGSWQRLEKDPNDWYDHMVQTSQYCRQELVEDEEVPIYTGAPHVQKAFEDIWNKTGSPLLRDNLVFPVVSNYDENDHDTKKQREILGFVKLKMTGLPYKNGNVITQGFEVVACDVIPETGMQMGDAILVQ